MISNWQKNGSLQRYAETSYWLHKDGAVLLRQSSGFVYADPDREPTRLYVLGKMCQSAHHDDARVWEVP